MKMGKLIIDATTGTVIAAENCYVVDDSALTEDNYSDSELCEIAKTGKSVQSMGERTGWGDNAYSWSVSYSPLSIRDEAEVLIEGMVYVDGDPEYESLVWVRTATQEQLEDISNYAMSHDGVWDGFRYAMTDAIMAIHDEHTKSSDD
jgi:hypothetical protein